MRLPEFIVNLFTKYAPVAPQTLANLTVELNTLYQSSITKMEQKLKENPVLEKKAEAIQFELEKLDPHTPEYDKKVEEFEKLAEQIDEPTIIEKIMYWCDKPLVRLALLVSFVVISRFIAKKLTETPKEKEVEIDEPSNDTPNNFQNAGYQQPLPYQPFNPYGGYYPQSPQPPYGQPFRQR